jgi:hypothetical protein
MALINQLDFEEFNPNWVHVIDPASVLTILNGINIPRPLRYNQLMVANDANGGGAFYAVYASGGLKNTDGSPKWDAGTPFDKLYDRGDILPAFLPYGSSNISVP